MVKLYKFKTNFEHCMTQVKLFGNCKKEYDQHFRNWVRYCIENLGNANVKTNGNNYTITFRHGVKRYKAKWIEY